ncbi:MAG: M23 family metallopeptidase [Bacteroidota bacterium]
MPRFKLYYYSSETLKFVEARWIKTKFVLGTAVALVLLVSGGIELNQVLDDGLGLGIGRARALAAENSLLKEQLRGFSSRLAGLEERLLSLNDRGNEMRLLVDLPTIDEDTRRAGFGGAEERVDLGASPDVDRLLGHLTSTVAKAEGELALQYKSYEEVVAAFEENKIKFSHIPAIKPMEGYYSPHGFGMRLHPVLRIMKLHEGLDIANDVGTPVYASGDGVVRFAGRTGGGYGILIEIDHGYGYTTAYAHLDKMLVKEGQRIKRGEMIARSGRTGLVSGPHLHYEVRLGGVRQNPIDYFFDDINYQDYKDQVAVFD